MTNTEFKRWLNEVDERIKYRNSLHGLDAIRYDNQRTYLWKTNPRAYTYGEINN